MKLFSKVLVLTLVVVFQLSLVAMAQTPNLSLTVPKVSAAPTIDGVINDIAWVEASQVGAKVVVDLAHTGDKLTQFPRVAYVAYDDTALYVAFINYSPNPAALVTGNAVSSNDEVELFLLPPGKIYNNNDFQIIVDNAGEAKNGHLVNYVVNKTAIQWIVELALPWANYGVEPPQPGDEWSINLNGHQVADGDQWLCWNPTYGGFHNPSRFATLIFGE
ncbi:MAG TPA: hypothetical protein GXX29_13850 [Firmicutes bacterium]|nr:hypothetical protein [Bacillota bacterium]